VASTCRYGEVIFTEIFSQLALPTPLHQLTGDNRCQNPDRPLNRKGSTLLPAAPVVLHASNTVNSTRFPSHHFANGRRMSQKLNAGQMNRPFFPFILRHHLLPMSGSNAADFFSKDSPARVRREPASYHI
jgi:transposase